MALSLRLKRGLKADIPQLANWEPGYCTDVNELYIGTPDGNKLIGSNTFVRLDTDNTLSGYLTLHANPIDAMHAATKLYVDNIAQGLNTKASVRVATTEPLVDLSGIQTIDGIALSAGDRILVKDQTNKVQNGVYVCSSGTWMRASDMDVWDEFVSAYVWVEEGIVNGDTGWVCIVDRGGILDQSMIEWIQFSSSGGSIIAGDGLSKNGNILSANLDTSTALAIQSGTGKIQLIIDNTSLKTDGGVLSLLFGASAGVACEGNDTRLHMQNTDLGTSSTTFYVGGGNGPKIKSLGTSLALRDSDDNTYVNLGVSSVDINTTNGYKNTVTTTTLTSDVVNTLPPIGGTLLNDNSVIDCGSF